MSRYGALPKLRLRIGDFKLGKLAQACDVLFFDATALLNNGAS